MTKKVVLASKSLFRPANGMRSPHSLVKIHNKRERENLNSYFLEIKFSMVLFLWSMQTLWEKDIQWHLLNQPWLIFWVLISRSNYPIVGPILESLIHNEKSGCLPFFICLPPEFLPVYRTADTVMCLHTWLWFGAYINCVRLKNHCHLTNWYLLIRFIIYL